MLKIYNSARHVGQTLLSKLYRVEKLNCHKISSCLFSSIVEEVETQSLTGLSRGIELVKQYETGVNNTLKLYEGATRCRAMDIYSL